MNKRILLTIPLFLLCACQRPIPEQATWSGTITLAESQQLPLRLDLDLRSSPPSGAFLVSDERTPIPEIRVSGDSLNIVLSEYGAAMLGTWNGSVWDGYFYRYRQDTIKLHFMVKPETNGQETNAPSSTTTPGVKLVGTYQVYYTEDASDSTTLAKFWMHGDSLFGTFIDPSGDHGLMVGTQTGATARVGRYIGWQANLIVLDQHEGEWTGKYYSRQFPPQPFRLVSRPGIPSKPLDPRKTRMKRPSAPFAFEGITAEGDTLRNSDSRFRGKALIIDIMGTWCHNCLDEAPLLQQAYSEFKEKGLEVVGLSFEITDDAATARTNLDIYRKRHGLTFPLLFAGSLDQANVDARIHRQLSDFFAYPTTIFVRKNGTVEHIHWGFKGPGTGEEYQHEVTSFFDAVRRLTSE